MSSIRNEIMVLMEKHENLLGNYENEIKKINYYASSRG